MKSTLSFVLLALTALLLGSCALPSGDKFDIYDDLGAEFGVEPDFLNMDFQVSLLLQAIQLFHCHRLRELQ